MVKVIITFKLMMSSPEIDLNEVKEKAKNALLPIGGEIKREEIVPVAFGLKALKLIVVADEDLGTDEMENKLNELEDVSSAEIIEYSRALG